MTSVNIHVGYLPGSIGKLTELHATYYGELWELGPRFEADIARGVTEFIDRYDASRNRMWCAVDDEGVVRGGIIIDGKSVEEKGAQLRYFILDPEVHGEGIGRKLLERAVSFCDTQGYTRTFLWTVDELEAAIHLYNEYGFVRTNEVEVHTNWKTDIPYRLFERVV